MSAAKSIKQELDETLRTSRALKARVPDEMEDYLHDSIVRVLSDGKTLSKWWGYIYKSIKQRLAFGIEAKPYVQLEDSIIPSIERVSIETKLDLRRALACLSKRKRAYIVEYYLDGYTLQEMKVRHGVSIQYIWRTIKQALAEMRECLEDRRC